MHKLCMRNPALGCQRAINLYVCMYVGCQVYNAGWIVRWAKLMTGESKAQAGSGVEHEIADIKKVKFSHTCYRALGRS